VICRVRENVYDTNTGTHLIIPQNATLIGTYDNSVTMGQERALTAWRRIIMPDASSIDLDLMPGSDRSGFAGFEDQVNNHYLKIFGAAALMSVFSAGIQLSQPQATNGQNYSATQTIAGAIGQQMGELGEEIARRNMQIQPTIEIRQGYLFNVMVTKDIVMPPWVESAN
jgi:type IV secretion system protein VirB10